MTSSFSVSEIKSIRCWYVKSFYNTVCTFLDEINWPDGDEAPPPDAQELITLLLRQNPLERLGTGTNTKSEDLLICGAVRDWVRTRHAQQATINPHVLPQHGSLFQVTGEEIEVIRQRSSLSCGLLTSSSWSIAIISHQSMNLASCTIRDFECVDLQTVTKWPWPWTKAFNQCNAHNQLGLETSGSTYASRSPLTGLPFTKSPAISLKVTGRKLFCIIYGHDSDLSCSH